MPLPISTGAVLQPPKFIGKLVSGQPVEESQTVYDLRGLDYGISPSRELPEIGVRSSLKDSGREFQITVADGANVTNEVFLRDSYGSRLDLPSLDGATGFSLGSTPDLGQLLFDEFHSHIFLPEDKA